MPPISANQINPNALKNDASKFPAELSAAETETIRTLLNYPSLERLFDANGATNLSAVKQKMRSTIADLERVIRRGSKTDAEKAATAVKAIEKTLAFLDELAQTRQSKMK